MIERCPTSLILLLSIVAAPWGASIASEADRPAEFARLLAEKSPALVTVKFMLKAKMGGMGDSESESEVTGVMIDPKGLVLCSNVQLGGIVGLMRRVMGSSAKGMSTNISNLKILVGDDTEGLDAESVARDTELDLAWIRVKNPGTRTFPYVDLSKGVVPRIGDPLFAIHRLGKHFDRLPVVAEGRVGGIARKPRDLYIPSRDLAEAMGLPVFTASGDVVGVCIMEMPDAEDLEGNPSALFSRASSLMNTGAAILPAADVVKATVRAKENAATRPAGQDGQDKDATDESPSEGEDKASSKSSKATQKAQ